MALFLLNIKFFCMAFSCSVSVFLDSDNVPLLMEAVGLHNRHALDPDLTCAASVRSAESALLKRVEVLYNNAYTLLSVGRLYGTLLPVDRRSPSFC